MTESGSATASRRITRFPAALLVTVICVGACEAGAQYRSELGAGGYAALRQAVRDATNDHLVALVASHPDDRYVMPAAYLRFLQGYRVAVILFTRGEGGQNNRGPEVGDELGAMRTLESEVCARLLDYDVYYLNRQDGGYCRTGEEALQLWGRRATTEDLARILRQLRPDIVMTTHDPSESHGHDVALLEVLPAAVALASDPTFEAESSRPIAAPRLFRGGRPDVDAPEEREIVLSMDTVDEVRGDTIRSLAYRALISAHRSQGPFRPIDELFQPDLPLVGVHVPGTEHVSSLHEGIGDVFDEITATEGAARARELRTRFEGGATDGGDRGGLPSAIGNPTELVARALELRAELLALDPRPDSSFDVRVQRRLAALDRVVLQAVGLRARITVPPGASAVPGEVLRFEFELDNGWHVLGDLSVTDVDGTDLLSPSKLPTRAIPPRGHLREMVDLLVPQARSSGAGDLFRASRFVPPLQVAVALSVPAEGGPQELSFLIDVPTELVPATELRVQPRLLLVPNGQPVLPFSVRVRHNGSSPLRGRVRIEAPPGFVPSSPYLLEGIEEPARDFPFSMRVPSRLGAGVHPFYVRAEGARMLVPLSRVDATTTPGLRVGLIRGVDDTAGAVVRGLGAEIVELSDEVLPNRSLGDLDTIVVDIRSLYHRESARAGYWRLLKFAEDGGRLVVFYHKNTEFNLPGDRPRPHPAGLELLIGKGRVTKEDAPVTLLDSDHELLNWPNKLRTEDWDGWVQERGLYFPASWGSAFLPLLAMNDPDQPEERGALLYGKLGRGEYVYCALALYRQLKTLHPGACRLFANLISPPRRERR